MKALGYSFTALIGLVLFQITTADAHENEAAKVIKHDVPVLIDNKLGEVRKEMEALKRTTQEEIAAIKKETNAKLEEQQKQVTQLTKRVEKLEAQVDTILQLVKKVVK